MKVEQRELTTIVPYERNPRKIGEDAIEAVARSIDEFGPRQPIVVDAQGVIVVGHARYYAASRLGLEKFPTHAWDDCTEEQARAYRLADNKTGEIAEWDADLLLAELRDVDFPDMGRFGFDMSVLDYIDPPSGGVPLTIPGGAPGMIEPDSSHVVVSFSVPKKRVKEFHELVDPIHASFA